MSAYTTVRGADPRVLRSRAAAIEAGTRLFLERGYAGTTMDDIARAAGLSKRTLYNHYADKEALFTEIVTDVIASAEQFARGLATDLANLTAEDVPAVLHDLARRLALAILRPEVIALRRLLISESDSFPELAEAYFHRAPGRVLNALSSGFAYLHGAGLLRAPEPRRAAEQFAYLVAGGPLDRAMLLGSIPGADEVTACATEGVETFLARHGTGG